jgi:sugar O-acyltransferase (sialic acid O-acetyltransferase NeuD family)
MALERIAVLGAGGLAQEVRWLISEINAERERFEFLGYLVSDLSALGERDSASDVLGDFGWLDESPEAVDALAIGIGSPPIRERFGRQLSASHPHLRWPKLVHPTVRLDARSCELGDGVVLCAGTIGTVDLLIEPFTLVNLACTLGHGARLGAGCVVNPTVNVSGGVDVGHRVLVGTGAQILQYVRIGDDATVGAGAMVHRDVEPGQTVAGVPARPLPKKS